MASWSCRMPRPRSSRRVYGVSPMRISVIPHGVPDLPRVDPDLVKPGLDLVGHSVILSFGLIGPGKGYELLSPPCRPWWRRSLTRCT